MTELFKIKQDLAPPIMDSMINRKTIGWLEDQNLMKLWNIESLNLKWKVFLIKCVVKG